MSMRLTLRALLAYLDEVLEPADREDIGAKIRESDFAKSLVERIRDVMRRLRLGTPKVLGKGLGADPNSVAEYLDHTMTTEAVQEFEKACLESDMNLAEVASCHQVLALVLGQPADIHPEMRRKMYEIIKRADEKDDSVGHHDEHPHVTVAGSVAAGAGVAGHHAAQGANSIVDVTATPLSATTHTNSPTQSQETRSQHAHIERARPAVPEYLLADRRRRRIASIMVAAILLIAAGLGLARMYGPFDGSHPIAVAMGIGEKPDEVAKANPVEPPPVDSDPTANPPEPGAPDAVKDGSEGITLADPNATTPVAPDGSVNAATPQAGAGIAPGVIAPLNPPVVNPGVAISAPSANAAQGESSVGPLAPGATPITNGQAGIAPVNPAAASIPGSGVGSLELKGSVDVTPPTNQGVVPDPMNPVVAAPGNAVDNSASTNGVVPTTPPVAGNVGEVPHNAGQTGPPQPMDPNGAVPPMPEGPSPSITPNAAVQVGRMSADGVPVLLCWRETPVPGWVRLNANETINSGERLLCLHSYQPTITLRNGLSLVLHGETQIEVKNSVVDDIPAVRIYFGRVRILNNGNADSKILIEPGIQESGTLTLSDPDSSVAWEVRRYLPPGSDPEKVLAKLDVSLLGSQGHFRWQGPGTKLNDVVASPIVIPMNSEVPVDQINAKKELPNWLTKGDLNNWDSLASLPMSRELDPKLNVAVRLTELTNSRRVEIQYLASRSLALLENFDSLVASFSNKDQRTVWGPEIEALQSALSRGPKSAGDLKMAFMNLRGEDGVKMYGFLWGASKADLLSGKAEELIAGMDSERLDVRVISYHMLRESLGVLRDPKAGPMPTYSYNPEGSLSTRQQAIGRFRTLWKEMSKKLTPDVVTETTQSPSEKPPMPASPMNAAPPQPQ